MNYVIWCGLCGNVRVDRHGELCVLCVGEIEALVNPIRHPPTKPRPPIGVRILNRITGRNAT
jgi:hypothetical protein